MFATRLLERLPIGTPYPAVAERLAEIVSNISHQPLAPNHAPPSISIVIDATVVGGPVVDLMWNALRGSRCRLVPVTFVHGERLTTVGRELRMGKAFMVSRLMALMQTDRVHLPPDHPEAIAMARELQDYELKADPDGDLKFGAFKVGTHDDLVTALGLAVLKDPPGQQLMSF